MNALGSGHESSEAPVKRGKQLTVVTRDGACARCCPGQVKLEWVAMAVGKVGFGVAICCFIVLLIK